MHVEHVLVVLESERPLLENLVRGFLRCPLSMLLLFVCIAVMEKGVWRREIENRCLWVDMLMVLLSLWNFLCGPWNFADEHFQM